MQPGPLGDGTAIIIEVARELALFQLQDVAELTRDSPERIAAVLAGRPDLFQRVDEQADRWRLVSAAANTAEAATSPGESVAKELSASAAETLRAVERGLVQDVRDRELTLQLAEQRIHLAQTALNGHNAPEVSSSLKRTRRRMEKLRADSDALPDPLLEPLLDWTVPMSVPANEEDHGDFDLDGVMRAARRQAASRNGVFGPARAALNANLAQSDRRPDLCAALDTSIRTAALRGDVFAVLALGCVAAVAGLGQIADSLVAAITTPAFRSVADRAARRIAYASLSSLARPGTAEAQRAVEGCTYLLRREEPGPDEMALLAPAAFQSSKLNPETAVKLIAEWLDWENDRHPDSAGLLSPRLARFGHFARNLGCSFDVTSYEAFKRGLFPLAESPLGELLILYLSDERNNALLFRPQRRSALDSIAGEDPDATRAAIAWFGAGARETVARVTSMPPRHELTDLSIKPGTRIAYAIERVASEQIVSAPDKFRPRRKGRADAHG